MNIGLTFDDTKAGLSEKISEAHRTSCIQVMIDIVRLKTIRNRLTWNNKHNRTICSQFRAQGLELFQRVARVLKSMIGDDDIYGVIRNICRCRKNLNAVFTRNGRGRWIYFDPQLSRTPQPGQQLSAAATEVKDVVISLYVLRELRLVCPSTKRSDG